MRWGIDARIATFAVDRRMKMSGSLEVSDWAGFPEVGKELPNV